MTLTRKNKDNLTAYYCNYCKTILGLEDETTGTGWTYDQCEHFTWTIVSVKCFYSSKEYEGCDKQYVEELKSKHVLKLQNGKFVFLLIPNTRGELNG